VVDEKIVKHIEAKLKKAVHIDNIREELLQLGHDVENVEDAISHIEKRNKFLKFFIISAVIVVLLVAVVLISRPGGKVQMPGEEGLSPDDVAANRELFMSALSSNDESACEKIAAPDMRAECFARMQPQEPIENLEEIQESKEQFDQALASGDEEACESITMPDMRAECIARTQQPEYTEEERKEEEEKVQKVIDDQSLFMKAMSERNPDYCSQIQMADIKAECLRVAS